MEGVKLDFTEDALRSIATRAIARKTGARGLRSIMEHPARHDVRAAGSGGRRGSRHQPRSGRRACQAAVSSIRQGAGARSTAPDARARRCTARWLGIAEFQGLASIARCRYAVATGPQRLGRRHPCHGWADLVPTVHKEVNHDVNPIGQGRQGEDVRNCCELPVARRPAAGAAAARHRRVPPHDRAAVRRPREVRARARRGDEGRQADPAGRRRRTRPRTIPRPTTSTGSAPWPRCCSC